MSQFLWYFAIFSFLPFYFLFASENLSTPSPAKVFDPIKHCQVETEAQLTNGFLGECGFVQFRNYFKLHFTNQSFRGLVARNSYFFGLQVNNVNWDFGKNVLTTFDFANWRNASFSNMDSRGMRLRSSAIENTIFHNSDFRGALFQNTVFKQVDFSGANFVGGRWQNIYLEDVDLRGTDLRDLSLIGVKLKSCYADESTVWGENISFFKSKCKNKK